MSSSPLSLFLSPPPPYLSSAPCPPELFFPLSTLKTFLYVSVCLVICIKAS